MPHVSLLGEICKPHSVLPAISGRHRRIVVNPVGGEHTNGLYVQTPVKFRPRGFVSRCGESGRPASALTIQQFSVLSREKKNVSHFFLHASAMPFGTALQAGSYRVFNIPKHECPNPFLCKSTVISCDPLVDIRSRARPREVCSAV